MVPKYNELIGESMNLKMKSIARVKKKDKKKHYFCVVVIGRWAPKLSVVELSISIRKS